MKPGANDFEDVEAFEQQTIDFMVEHRDTYWAVVDGKIVNSAQSLDNRTEINDEVIYPERGDRDIMRDAAMLAETTHKGIGAVLVASRDSDFWIVRRSLEEVFGFEWFERRENLASGFNLQSKRQDTDHTR